MVTTSGLISQVLVAVVATLLLCVLPGLVVARAVRARDVAAGGVVLSLLLLFHSVLLLDIVRIPVTFAAVTVVEWSAALLMRAFWRRAGGPADAAEGAAGGFSRMELLLPALPMVALLLLLLRTTLQPMPFLDAWWRWDFMAQHLLYDPSLDHYPPISAADFRSFLYPDGMAPVVSLGYWVSYAALGAHVPSATSVFIALQYAAVAWLVYRTAASMFTSFGGLVAVAVLASSRAFFGDVAIGQDTGLTALAVAGMCFFLLTAEKDDTGSAAMAGACAALGALTREYALAFAFAGVAVAMARGMAWRNVAVFAVTASSLVATWYLRNWLRTGNPLYDNPVAGLFPGNPVHTAMLQFYGGYGASDSVASEVAQALASQAPLPLLLGLVGAATAWRRCAPLLALCVLNTVLCIAASRYTVAGPVWGLRVLSPTWPLLSVCAAALGVSLARRWRPLLIALILGVGVVSCGPAALIWPNEPAQVPMRYWTSAAMSQRDPVPTASREIGDALEAKFPQGVCILTDDTSTFACVAPRPHGCTFVSLWSPQVLFLFDPSVSGKEALRRLQALGVQAVLVTRPFGSINRVYCDRFPFFRDELDRWPVVFQSRQTALYMLP